MKNIIKTVSLLTLIAVIPGAMAATSRVSVTNKTASRLPSIAGRIIASTTNSTTTSSSTASYYDVADCVEKYEDCLRSEDVCGVDFEECTTNVLFHAQMPKCSSVLYQCSAAGVQQLFGTSAINALSTVYSYVLDDRGNATKEVARYTYPTENSEINNLIAGAKEGTKLTNEQCVRRYTNCLKRDDICGENFELCTSTKEFKKQAMLCDSTFERCPTDAKRELFGSTTDADRLIPTGESRLKQMIEEGAATAALNAVKTCQKVTDTCLYNACVKNPLRCVEGISTARIATADFVANGGSTNDVLDLSAVTDAETYTNLTDASSVRKMLKTQCLETIGANRYCHMTYLEHKPSDKDLVDIELQEDVFSLAYSARKDAVNTKIQEAVKKFDTKAKNNCVDTIKSCTMRSCGGGLGSVCYKQSRTNTSSVASSASRSRDVYGEVRVNGTNTYDDIKSGCSAIVNADANCIYAATSSETNGYEYMYYDEDGSTFATLFPQYSESATADPIGAVATLNALLATSYNDAAIENMKKQCQNIALSCVKSMCGKDYTNCYRNRTDIIASGTGTYNTDQYGLDKSMNRMGGVLDYNIVIGLCMNTVKSSAVCEEHLKVANATWRNSRDGETWGGNTSVRNAWLDSNTIKATKDESEDVLVACMSSDDNCPGTMSPQSKGNGELTCEGVTDTDIDGNLCQYNVEVRESQSDYILTNTATTLFQTLLVDVEKEAQAKYNAKLTKEQNICLGNNSGGIMGTRDNVSTFMWVKLKSNKVPKAYETKGLTAKQFVASNDLYGSFCRARITVMSDDKDIQDLLVKGGSDSVAYFAVGDSFTCGSWISNTTLQKISEKVGEREVCKQGYGKWENGECNVKGLSTKEKISYAWGTVAPALAGTGLGLGLTESGLLGGYNGSSSNDSISGQKSKTNCISYANNAMSASDPSACQNAVKNAKTWCDRIADNCSGVDSYSKLEDCKADADNILTTCRSSNGTYSYENSNKTTRWLVPIASGVGAGALGAGITASVIQQNKENIKNEAAQEWLDKVGEHIQCYLGADELGTYGDVVSIELD